MVVPGSATAGEFWLICKEIGDMAQGKVQECCLGLSLFRDKVLSKRLGERGSTLVF